MTTTTALLTNRAYGYPTRGARRRRKPTILACLRQTANAKATAIQERNYANRAGSFGPSATAYVDRDGTIVRAIDPAKYAAWSQGDVAHPNTKLATIAAAVASGVNMNEWVHESIECSGAGTEPFTDAQFESVAHLVAAASRALGLPINRSTVVVHADINSVSRRSDPWPSPPARPGLGTTAHNRLDPGGQIGHAPGYRVRLIGRLDHPGREGCGSRGYWRARQWRARQDSNRGTPRFS
jgi:hypothetical protein